MPDSDSASLFAPKEAGEEASAEDQPPPNNQYRIASHGIEQSLNSDVENGLSSFEAATTSSKQLQAVDIGHFHHAVQGLIVPLPITAAVVSLFNSMLEGLVLKLHNRNMPGEMESITDV